MIGRLFLSILLVLLMRNASSQTYIFDIPEPGYLPSRIPSDSLFKKNVISGKRIRKAYLLKTWGRRDWNGNAEFKDTLSRFDFDSTGTVVQKVRYGAKGASKTFILTSDEPEYCCDSLLVSNKHFGNGSRRKKIFLWKNKQNKLEPAVTVYEVTDKDGRVVERIHTPTALYLNNMDCLMDEPPFHLKYFYDRAGRLIRSQDLISKKEIRYEYSDFGLRITQTNSSDTSKITDFVSIFHNEYQTIYNFKDRQIIVLPDTLSDQLVWVIAIRDVQYYGSQSTIYEFAYVQ